MCVCVLRLGGQFRVLVSAIALFLGCASGTGFGNGIARGATADFIHAEGTRLVDGNGENFAIKGINLGNWLVPEGYMFKFKHARSPTEIAGVVETLVGPEQAARFWTEFRDVYVAK